MANSSCTCKLCVICMYLFKYGMWLCFVCRCLWFIMEPLIKNENYSYSFYKKIIENIKQTKDAQNPESREANEVGICE